MSYGKGREQILGLTFHNKLLKGRTAINTLLP